MGGAIRVILIKDNKVTKTTKWTNPLPSFVHHYKFIERDSEYWDEYINEESDMASPEDDFAPEGYGLVVLDYDNKRIFDCQGYSAMQTIYLTEVHNDIISAKYNPSYAERDDYLPKIVEVMIEKGILKAQHNFNPPTELKYSFKEIMKMEAKRWQVQRGFNYFYIDFEKFGWTSYKFPETEEGYKEYFDLINKNYKLTELEKEHWKKWIGEYENDEK